MIELVALLAVGVLGFSAGLFTFKVKSHWCRSCGTTLTCAVCAVLRRSEYRRPAWLPMGNRDVPS
jgi:hypothetical protein